MPDYGQIQTQLKSIVHVVSCELERVEDTLFCLESMTTKLFKETTCDEEAMAAWLEGERFGVGEDGFFQSQSRLETFRKGALSENVVSFSWPPEKSNDKEARFRMFCHRKIGDLLHLMHRRLPGAAWIYYQDVTNTALQYPYIDQITAITPDFDWSQYHTYASVKPEVNPQREVRWSAPHVDYAGKGLIVAASIPVYREDRFVGLWSIDVEVDSLVRHDVLISNRKTQLTCIVDSSGSLIASSQGISIKTMAKGEVSLIPFEEVHESYRNMDLGELFSTETGYVNTEAGKEDYQVHWKKVFALDWMCITVLSVNELISTAKDQFKNAFTNLGKGDAAALEHIESFPEEMLELAEAYNEMVVNLDRAQRRLLEKNAELTQEKLKAEAASQAKSTFLANMSHELRTPLNGILGVNQLLKTTELNAEQDDYVEMAILSARRLTTLLGDILDLTKIESGKISVAQKSINLAEMFESMEQLFGLSCRQKGVALTWRIDDAIPDDLIGDPMKFSQIMNNLVGNAVKFTDKGKVEVEAYPLPGTLPDVYRVLFSVSDTGVGIEESQIERLFEPFTQVDEGYQRSHQGAGLGLSIVRRLVLLLGGELTVASEPGIGTTFCFCLPFKRNGGARPTVSFPCTERPSDPGSRAILLVEDDRVNSMAIKSILEKGGYRITAVENGVEALRELSCKSYSLVLMDIQLPVMDGIEATKAIRAGQAGAQNVGIPIVALTAYAMSGDREEFLAAGMNGYLAKPVEVEPLGAMICKVLPG